MLHDLYFKKYTSQLEAVDFIQWAQDHLYLDDSRTKRLASMPVDSNFFEVQELFKKVRNLHQLEEPTELECAKHRLKSLHAELIKPESDAINLVNEIYRLTIDFDLAEEQLVWLEISDAIDDFKYGDNLSEMTEDALEGWIRIRAREMWHTQKSIVSVDTLIGQKVTAIDTEAGFLLELDKGAITIECPWRIRSAEQILVGETDIRTNQVAIRTVTELLVGKLIIDIQLYENCPFVIIQVDDIFLDIFHASAYFDGWTMTDQDDFYLFSFHGGQLA
ncbi:hypothetical protein LG275_08070 [Chryseomicrobium palamuruense]